MIDENAGTSKELARLIHAILNHPKATSRLRDGIYDLLAEVSSQVDHFSSPDCIELYLEAFAHCERTKARAQTKGGD